MLDQQRDYVLRSVEERGVRLVRLWFTDVLGTLKSLAISPAELDNALERRHVLRRFVDRRVLPGPGVRRAGDARSRHVRAAPVGRPEGARGADLLRHPPPRRHPVRGRPAPGAAPPRAGRARQGPHVLRRPRRRVLLLRADRAGAAAGADRRGRILRPDDQRHHRRVAQEDDPHARDDGHPGRVQLPRGRARASRRSTSATPMRSPWPTA